MLEWSAVKGAAVFNLLIYYFASSAFLIGSLIVIESCWIVIREIIIGAEVDLVD